MARPTPIIVPGGLGTSRTATNVNVDAGALINMFENLARQRREQGEQQQAVEALQGLFGPKQPEAAPVSEELAGLGGEPTGGGAQVNIPEAVPTSQEQLAFQAKQERQAPLFETLGRTKTGRGLVEKGFAEALFGTKKETTKEKETAKIEARREAGLPEFFDARAVTEEKSKAMFGDRFANLNKKQSNEVLDEVLKEQSLKRVETIKAEHETKLDLPIPATDLPKYINPETFEKYPQGTTLREVEGAFVASPAQQGALTDLDNVGVIVSELDALTQRLNTETDALKANVQGTKRFALGKARADAVAASYMDTREAFTGVLSRSLGGEKGVLTDKDIKRVVKSQPAFNDTKQIRDFKMGTIQLLVDTAINAKRRAITGKPADRNLRKTLNIMIDRLESIPEAKGGKTPPPTVADIDNMSEAELDAFLEEE